MVYNIMPCPRTAGCALVGPNPANLPVLHRERANCVGTDVEIEWMLQ